MSGNNKIVEQRAELHSHTEFSQLRLLDCCNKVERLIDRAVELGLYGVAITDHESTSGYIRAIKHLKKGKESGKIPEDFKLVLGNEIYLVDKVWKDEDGNNRCTTPYYHFILLAKDAIGCRQLRELSSLAWDNSFFTGKMERVPTAKTDLERIINSDKGHIIASTACLGGELPKLIEEYLENPIESNLIKIDDFIRWMQNLFGDDFYLEMQPSTRDEQIIVNKNLIKLSKFYGIKTIITNDVHYLSKDLRQVHAYYLNSRDEDREVSDFYEFTYMMSCEEIHELMDSSIGEDNVSLSFQNSVEVANKTEFYDLERPTIVPAAEIPEFKLSHFFKNSYSNHPYMSKYSLSSNIYDVYLLKLIEDGFQKKIPYKTLTAEQYEEMIDRIEIELKEMWLVTEKLHNSISSYYITTLELVEIMWNEGDSLVGIARGSVTGMFTMYLIGITQLNPLPWGLPHWRHISHEKIELSDVDIDSQANRRSQIIEAVKKRKGERKVLNCCTFKTEGAKSAILTAGKGIGIDHDITSYIANMIPVERGFTWSLHDCAYGNKEEGRKPIKEFVDECNEHPGLLETAMEIEGLVCGRSIHASAVYIFNSDFLDYTARMKAPNGVYITQFNMKDVDYTGGLKMDFLTIKSLDIIRTCMKLLIKYGYMQDQGSLRATYDKYIHPDVLDYDTPEMWDMVANNEVVDLFQMSTQIGLQSAKRINPHSLMDLATANSVMRLMSKDSTEQPIDTYVRYKNNIQEWYDCMRNDYHLDNEQISIMEKYLKETYGIGATQEDVMLISMDEKVANFSVKEANKLRKGIAKKDKTLQKQMKKMFFEKGISNGAKANLLEYVWNEVIEKQLGYSFSKNHTVPYSGIGLQELNLAYHFPIIYWNCACLIIDSGADEDRIENKSTRYGEVATAIANMQHRGTHIALAGINTSDFGFIPDEKNNQIIYSLNGISGIGENLVKEIISHRPYTSFEDFYERMVNTKIVTPSKLVTLIKAGCFCEVSNEDRTKTMDKFLMKQVKQVNKLGLSQLSKCIEYKILPDNIQTFIDLIQFKKQILSENNLFKIFIDPERKVPSSGYHDRFYKIPKSFTQFFENNLTENSVISIIGENYVVSEKKLKKEIDRATIPLKEKMMETDIIDKYNEALLIEIRNKYAKGTVSRWEMESMSFYYSEHELKNLDEKKYGVVNFFEQPENPEVYDYYTRYFEGKRKSIPKFKINRIAGAVLDNDNNKHTITLLTVYGVVNVRLQKGQYLHYNRQISANLDGSDKKTVLEKSWFKRGTLIMCAGYRSEDVFRCYRYLDTIYPHTVAKIEEIRADGTVDLITERVKSV